MTGARPEDSGGGRGHRALGGAASLPTRVEVLVIGAGIIGAAISSRLASAGLDVCLLDRVGPAAGTSSAGEGNVLVSDKAPGPDLALALRGVELWHELAEEAGDAGDRVEFEPKGGLVVARGEEELEALFALAESQRLVGSARRVGHRRRFARAGASPHRGPEWRGLLRAGLPSAARGSCRLPRPPVRRATGACLVRGAEVVGAEHDRQGNVCSVRTTMGTVGVDKFVVNAAGPWAGEVARHLGTDIPVEPRRGHVLVTEPEPLFVRHKVYEAGYVSTVHDDGTGLACSAVVEATRSGTMLLGSSREFVGFSREIDPGIMRTIAARAVALFPDLARARLIRAYVGFRPTTPDRLPIIGADRSVGGIYHATGHEGAGIGLALVTAEIVEDPRPRRDAFCGPGAVRPRALCLWHSSWRNECQRLSKGLVEARRPRWQHRRPAPVPPAHGRLTDIKTGRARDCSRRFALWSRGRSSPTSARPPSLRFRFDGRELTAPRGSTIAGALLSNGAAGMEDDANGRPAARALLRDRHVL